MYSINPEFGNIFVVITLDMEMVRLRQFTLLFIFLMANYGWRRPDGEKPAAKAAEVSVEAARKNASRSKAIHVADSLTPYLKQKGYSTSLILLADMSLPMDVKRFYVIKPDSQKILNSFLIAHGKGGNSTIDFAAFSNAPGSLCSSPGKYLIGDTFWGEYGKGYRLHGLDATNNNAVKRLVVFHYFLPQTSEEHDYPLYYSAGCPMLSLKDFQYCDARLKKETKPVLMFIYR